MLGPHYPSITLSHFWYIFYTVSVRYTDRKPDWTDGTDSAAAEHMPCHCYPPDVISVHIWRHPKREWRHQLWTHWASAESAHKGRVTTAERCCWTEDW